MRDTERRLAGDVLAEALAGRRRRASWPCRLRPFGVGAEAAVLVFAVDDGAPPPGRGRRSTASSPTRAWARWWPRASGCCARSSTLATGIDPVALAARAREALAAEHGELRAAASPAAPVGVAAAHLPRGALRARGGGARQRRGAAGRLLPRPRRLPAAALAPGRRGAAALLRQRARARSRTASGEYGDELLRSLEAFIEQNGQWEKAARELYCHRHTLRYRIRRVEQLTGRDLSSARDRIEFWLALRARELVH